MSNELYSTKENAAIMRAEESVDRLREAVEIADPLHRSSAERELAKAEAKLAKLKSPWTDGRAP